MRRWLVTLAALGAVLILAAVLRPSVAVPLYGAGLVLLFGCVGWLLRDSDVLADRSWWRCSCGFEGDIDAAAGHVVHADGSDHVMYSEGSLESPEAVEMVVQVTPDAIYSGPVRRVRA